MPILSATLGLLVITQAADPKVSVSLRCEPLPSALKAIFPAATDQKFVFRGRTRDRKLTLFVKDRSRSEVLRKIAEILEVDISQDSSGEWSVREQSGFLAREAKVLAYYRVGFQREMQEVVDFATARRTVGPEFFEKRLAELTLESNRIREQKAPGWQNALEAMSYEMERISSGRTMPEMDWVFEQIGTLSLNRRMEIWNSKVPTVLYSPDGTSKAWLSTEPFSGAISVEVNVIPSAGSLGGFGASTASPPASYPDEEENGFMALNEIRLKDYQRSWVPDVISPGDAEAAELLALSQDRPVIMEGLRSVSGDYTKILSEDPQERADLRIRFKEQGDWILLQPEDLELKRALDPEESLYRGVEQSSRPSFEQFSLLIHHSSTHLLERMAQGDVRGDFKLRENSTNRVGIGLWRSLPGIFRQQLEQRKVVMVSGLPIGIQPAILDVIRFPGLNEESDSFLPERRGQSAAITPMDALFLEQSERTLDRVSGDGVTVVGDVNDGVDRSLTGTKDASRGKIYEGNWTLYFGTSAKESIRWNWRFTRKKPFGKEPIPKSNEPLHRHGHGPSETDKPGFRAEPD